MGNIFGLAMTGAQSSSKVTAGNNILVIISFLFCRLTDCAVICPTGQKAVVFGNRRSPLTPL
jgi:hypothetical protein